MVIESNGKRTEVRFQGTLLVPVEVWGYSCDFLWVGTLSSSDTKVDVIAFNTSKKEDFASLLQNDLDALRLLEPTDNVRRQIAFIERTLKEMASFEFVKTPEDSLLDAASKLVSDFMRRSGQYVTPRFRSENTVYTVGISAMYNN